MSNRLIFNLILVFVFNNIDAQPMQKNEHDILNARKPIVSVLGLFHFEDKNSDDYKPKYPFNILEVRRQEELNELIHSLASFRPTKIMVEVNRNRNEELNKEYLKYLDDNFSITEKKNEIYQIAFKLGKMLGHKKIYASDNPVGWFGEKIDWKNYDAKSHRLKLGQEKKYQTNYEDFLRLAKFEDSLKTAKTLKEFLIHANNPSNSQKSHQVYLASTAITGAGDNYLGADAVARWYRRNIHIYSNVYDMSEKNDRILVLYGVGHLHILRQLFIDSPAFEYDELTDYLN